MEIYIVIALLIVLIGLLLVYVIRLDRRLKLEINESSYQNNSDISHLSKSISDDLAKFQYGILKDFKDDLSRLNLNTNNQLHSVTKEVQAGLSQGFEKTNNTFFEVSKQLVSVNETQKNLHSLSNQIIALENILTDKGTRGRFGEIELNAILENAYGIDKQFYELQYLLSNSRRVDAILYGPEALGIIPVDSKFPLENYLRMYDENIVKADQVKASMQFARDIKKHIDDIADRYIIANETADIAFMFVPAEAIFAEIYARHEDVVQYSYSKKVYIVSPSTIMAYITTLKALNLGIMQNEKVDLMQQEFAILAKEFERFTIRSDKLSSSYRKLYNEVRDLEITSEKIRQRFDLIMAVDLEDKVSK